jgi:spore cortex formation protein SpoVR/YcgB (stage V sporulation)
VVNGALLNEADAKLVLHHLASLWTYDVLLQEVDLSGAVLKEHVVTPQRLASAAE